MVHGLWNDLDLETTLTLKCHSPQVFKGISPCLMLLGFLNIVIPKYTHPLKRMGRDQAGDGRVLSHPERRPRSVRRHLPPSRDVRDGPQEVLAGFGWGSGDRREAAGGRRRNLADRQGLGTWFRPSPLDWLRKISVMPMVGRTDTENWWSESLQAGESGETCLQPRLLQQGERVGGDRPVEGAGGRRNDIQVAASNNPLIIT